jgi:phosphatidate cytidylyltransferase
MNWPHCVLSGGLYGLTMAFLGLMGDLTESVLKRDAGIKDSGTILPGHGGMLDRFDSYILSAPVAFMFMKYILPRIAAH